MILESRKVLVLCTSHVTKATAELLDNSAAKDWPVIGGPYADYGWFIYVHDENDGKIPDDLWAVCQFANKNGFDNILFDCDASQVDGLPTWEW